METINAINKFDLLMMCFTSADGSGSNLLFIGPLAGVVDEAFKEDIMDDLYFVDGVISRKNKSFRLFQNSWGNCKDCVKLWFMVYFMNKQW